MMKMNKMKMLKFQMVNQEKLKRKRDEERIRRKKMLFQCDFRKQVILESIKDKNHEKN